MLLGFFLVCLLAACGSGEPQAICTLTRDSAGVTLVENVGTFTELETTWLLASEPATVIGGPGSTPTLFQVGGGCILSEGFLAVANQGSGEIFLFDEDGELIRAHGRKGEGPGEYRRPVVVGLLGADTLVVVDSDNRRISLVHAHEGYLGSSRIDDDLGSSVTPRGMFSDGTVVVGGGYHWSTQSGDQATSGYSRPTTSYRAVTLDGRLAADFGEFPGAEFNIKVRTVAGGESSMSAGLIPFGKHPSVAVGADRFLVGTRDRWEIEVFDSRGNLNTIVRMDRDPSPVRTEDVEALIQEDLTNAGDPSAEAAIRRDYAEMPVPETMPAFSRLVVDDLGYLWVERFRPPEEEVPVFDVLDPDGAFVATVTLPPGNRILQIAGEWVLTLHRDELDEESVKVFRLTRE